MGLKYTKEILENAIKNSNSFKEVREKLGIEEFNTGKHRHLKKRIEHFKLDTIHFEPVYSFSKNKIDDSEIFKKNSLVCFSLARVRLFKRGIKEKKCEKCGLTEWLGEPISFDVDHINRKPNDNRYREFTNTLS
jgi:hypothetical protein